MATIFIILAIVFAVAVFFWVRKWNDNEPKISIPSNNGNGSQGSVSPVKEVVVSFLNVTYDILFGKDGKLTKGETFFEGKIKNNSQLYIRLQIGMEGSVVLCGINDNVTKPKIQIAVEYGEKRCIANPCNSQRQSVQPYMIHNGESIWLSSDVLNGIILPEYFVLRFFYRVDNGNGYGSWQVADAINVHNI